jgi:hypothetical protein
MDKEAVCNRSKVLNSIAEQKNLVKHFANFMKTKISILSPSA